LRWLCVTILLFIRVYGQVIANASDPKSAAIKASVYAITLKNYPALTTRA
jgi:hypothetical protein